MSDDLSLTQTPNGGWQFTQPQTGWSMPTPLAWTLDGAVVQVIKHRLANPAITAKHNLPTTKDEVRQEMISFTRARLGMSPVGTPDPPKPGASPKAAKCCGG